MIDCRDSLGLPRSPTHKTQALTREMRHIKAFYSLAGPEIIGILRVLGI